MKLTFYILFLSIIFSCTSHKETSTDLIGYWSFDNVKGDLVPDLSRNHLDAINLGAVTAKGKIGDALHFDGKSALQVNHQKILDEFTDGITISAWIKKDSALNWNTIVSREVRESWSEYFGLAVVKNKGLFSIDPDGNNYHNVKSDEDLLPGVWYHLAGTFDNETFNLYVNGNLLKSDKMPSPLKFSDENPLLIGGNSNDRNQSLIDCFVGVIDEVRIYKRALTLAEILNLATE